MAIYTGQFFYLGNLTEVDTDETDYDSENPNAILGTYTLPSLVTLALDDVDNNIVATDDDVGGSPDTVDYDLGGGNISTQLDSTSLYNATLTYGDTTTATFLIIVIQMQNGDTFVHELTDGDLDNKVIYSINLTSVYGHGYSGFSLGNFITGASTAVCFAAGTMITTPQGEIAVEHLSAGDVVTTLSGAAAPVRWITRTDHKHPGKDASICIARGALGFGRPDRDLYVSPQHRIMAISPIVARMFGESAVLIPAKALLEMPDVYQTSGSTAVSYYHILLPSHQILLANKAPAESLYLGSEACKILPKLVTRNICDPPPAASLISTSRARQMVHRHIKNDRPLVQLDVKIPEAPANPLALNARVGALARQYPLEAAGLV